MFNSPTQLAPALNKLGWQEQLKPPGKLLQISKVELQSFAPVEHSSMSKKGIRTIAVNSILE